MKLLTNDWEEVLAHAKDWVILDFDQVIIDGADAVMSGDGFTLLRSHIRKWREVDLALGNERTSHIFKQYQIKLADTRIPGWINTWKQNDVTVLCLSLFWSGPHGVVPDMTDIRLKQMRDFNIGFSTIHDPFEFEHLGTRPHHPIHKEGLMLTCNQPKGPVLSHFLDRVSAFGIKPKHILFVDDQGHNVNEIGDCCAQYGIDYTGVVYRGCFRPDKIFDRKVMAKQIAHFEATHEWLPEGAFGSAPT